MRLLNTRTIILESFTSENEVPRYAILSHTWGHEEVTFSDMESGIPEHLHGYWKIKTACQQSCRDGIKYLWVDTCCIDKQSSSELSEAMNSMFKWYAAATVCYVFLEDVEGSDIAEYRDLPLEMEMTLEQEAQIQQSLFAQSRWWTRGWTLQELIAPYDLIFFDGAFRHIGSKAEFVRVVSLVANIDEDVLLHKMDLGKVCVATKMSWAAGRKTTRLEDIPYSLLGIFDINMAMIYGEGDKAFIRLQHEIIKSTNDQTIFAWSGYQYQNGFLFAPQPSCFKNKNRIISLERWKNDSEFSLTNAGLDIQLPIWRSNENPEKDRLGEPCHRRRWIVPLACRYETDFSGRLALELEQTEEPGTYVLCSTPQRLFVFDTDCLGKSLRKMSLMIRHESPAAIAKSFIQQTQASGFPFNKKCVIVWNDRPDLFAGNDCYPPQSWNSKRDVFWQKRSLSIIGALHLFTRNGFKIVLVMGHERNELSTSNKDWGKGWVSLEAIQMRTTLHEHYERYRTRKWETSKHKTHSICRMPEGFLVQAAIKSCEMQEEEVFLVDLSFK